MVSFKEVSFKSYLLSLILISFVTACGGGGDGSSSSEQISTRAPKETGVSNVQFSKTGSTSFDISSSDGNGDPISCHENELSVELEISRDGTDESFESIEQDNIIVNCDTKTASDIALVLDNSGSEKDHIQDIIEASTKMADEILNNGGQVSMTRVSTNSKVIGPLSANSSEVKSAIAQQKTGNGWTSLFDGIRLGNETLANSDASEISNKEELTSFCESNRRLGMVVFTDGRENNSNDEKSYRYDFVKYPGDGISTTQEDLLKLRVGNVITPIYNVGMGPDVDHELLSEISTKTGGRYLHIENREQIPDVFNVVKDYITTPTQVCAKFSKNICGSRKIKMRYKWKNRQSGESVETNNSEKILNVHIPCEGELQAEDNEIEDDSSKEEIVSEVVETSLVSPNNMFADNRTTKIYFPSFDDNNGQKELLSVHLEYSLKGSSKILAANYGPSASSASKLNITQSLSINGALVDSNWKIADGYDENTQFENLDPATEDDLKSAKSGKTLNNIGSFAKSIELSGKHRFLSQDYRAFKGYRPYLVSITHKPYTKVAEGSDPNMFYNLDFQVTGDVKLVYQWRAIEKPYIKFLDKGLESAVRTAISKKSGNIYIEDVADVTSLNISSKSIRSLEGLQYFKSLKKLDASRNKISDISQLNGLVNLESLNLDRNSLANIDGIASLKNLSYLNLNTNLLTSISALEEMSSLSSLYLGNNKIVDITTLANLNNLSRLGINNNPIVNISPVSKLLNLTYLYMNQIACECDISLLSDLQKLYYLNLNSNTIVNEKYLTVLSSLKKLYINSIKGLDYQVLSELKLSHLYMNSNNLTHVDFLKGLTSIKQLSLGHNQLNKECLSVVSTLVSLQKLWLNNNNFNEEIDLSSLTNLNQLNLDSNSIEQLNLKLSEPSVMKKLWLRNNSIENLNSLNIASNVFTYLYLDSNKLVDLSSLEKFTNLTYLFARYNQITSIDSIKSLQNITNLYFDGNEINNISSLLSLSKLRVARLFKNPLLCDDQKILVDMKYEGKTATYSNIKDCKYQYIKDKPPVEEEPVEEVTVVYGESTVSKFVTGNLFASINSSANMLSESVSEGIKVESFNDENGSLEVYEIKVKVFADSSLESTSKNFSKEGLTNLKSSLSSKLNVSIINQDKTGFTKDDLSSDNYLLDKISSSTVDQYNEFLKSEGSINSELFPQTLQEQEVFTELTISGDELAAWLKAESLNINFTQEVSAESSSEVTPNFSMNVNANLSGTVVITYMFKKKQ